MPVCVRAAVHLPLGTLFLRPGGGRIFPSEHFFCDPAARPSALHPAAAFGRGRGGGRLAMPPPPSRRPARPVCTSELPFPPLSRAAEHAGPAPACAAEPPPVPPPSCTGPAPLNALVPPRLHRRTPCPSPSRAAEHAGPLPVGAPETSPEGPQYAPESPFRGHLSKSRPRSWVFRGIFRTFGCKWMQKMSFAANNIIRIS